MDPSHTAHISSDPPAFDHHHNHHELPPGYHTLPVPDEPPPSYDYATHSDTTPLLVGPPPDYGTYRAYQDSDTASTASGEPESSSRSFPEWAGQFFVVLSFIGIMYGFWIVVNDPNFDGFPG